MEGTENIQSGNFSEIGHNNSRVRSNEDLDEPDTLKKEVVAGHPVTCPVSKGKNYLVKSAVVMNQRWYDLFSRS